jgi:serine/threonine-protein kinase
MGVVYRAHDERLDRDVALKLFPPGTVVESAARKRFRKEAVILSRLNHPNIATVHDFDTQDGTDFLVQEFIEGLSLDAILATGPLSESEIINLGSQLVEGLAAAHEHGVIHRDLKPANMRVTPEARLKILDFGLADILRGEFSPTAVTETLSETKGLVGTLPYMAPEQLLEDKLDARTDIWAAGCVLYEMATGRRPFLGSGPALTDAILHQAPASLSKLNPRISPAINAVIQKCLEKKPQQRYSSAREIAVDLQRATSKTTPVDKGQQLRRWFVTLAAAIAVTGTVGGGARLWSTLQRIWLGAKPDGATAEVQTVPHESYLAGLKLLERWDKPANLQSAAGLFEQAVKSDPNFALGYSALAEVDWARYRLEHDSRWVEEAEKNCRRATELNRNLPAVYVTLARVHNGRGQYNLALQEIQEALQLEPRNPDALLTEATVYASMGQEDKAEYTYKTAVALHPENWGGYYELGAFYYRYGRNAEAAAQFERVLQTAPDNALAQATLGGVLQLLHKDAEAEQHLMRSIELQPSYTAYTNLGALYIRKRRWAEAASTTRKALEINASDWNAWANLGLASEWLDRKSEAEKAYRNEQVRLEELLKVGADDAEVRAELGLVYSRWHLREKALALIETALARAPDNPNILAAASEARENLGDRSLALELVKKALARGLTLEELANNPGQRKLILDSRFREIARQFNKNFNPALQQP